MIYLISSCTSAKNIRPYNNLMLRNYCSNDFNCNIYNWKNTIHNTTNRLIARDLYKGFDWQVTLEIEKIILKQFSTNLLVSSAGYGLIDADSKISSYSCTFAKREEDSVYILNKESNTTQVWWDNINSFDKSEFNLNGYIFIFVSYEYLIAMSNTINELIKIFNKRLFIINVSKKNLPTSLKSYILQFDMRFNSYEKGTMTTIVSRCMRWLSNEIINKNIELDHCKLQTHIDTFLSNYEYYKRPKREILTEDTLYKKILEQIKTKNIKSGTQGLKDLRTNGFACEQKRYMQAFKKVINNE